MNPDPLPSNRWEVLEERKAVLIPLATGIAVLLGVLFIVMLDRPLIGHILLIVGLAIPLHALWLLTRNRLNSRSALWPALLGLVLYMAAAAVLALPRSLTISWIGSRYGNLIMAWLPIVAVILGGLFFLYTVFKLVARCTTAEADISALKSQVGGYRGRGKVVDGTYRCLYDSSPTPVASIDMSQYVSSVNPAWSEFTGYSASESVGNPLASFLEEEGIRETGRLFAREESPAPWDTQVRAKDGRLLPARLTVVPIDIEDERHGFHCFFEKNSHLIALERQILLLQRVQSVKPLVKNLAMSLGAGSRAIQTMMRWKQGQRITVDEAQRALNAVRRVLRRSGILSDELRLFERALEEPAEDYNVNVVAKRAVDFVQRIENKEILIEEDCTEEELFAHGKAAELEQVLINICMNAVEAMMEGGTLRVATERIGTDKSFLIVPGARIIISDTGPGIPPEIAEADLNMYPSFDSTADQPGLGLVISNRTIQRYRGHLSLHRNTPTGTRVEIELPLSAKKASAGNREESLTHG